jgi:hypothetical protein
MWCWIGNLIVIENLCSQENMLRYLWRTLIKLPRPRFLCACVTCLIRLEISHKLWSIYCVSHSKVHFLSFFSFLFFTHLFFGYESSYCSFLVSYVLTLDFCHTYAAERGPSFKAWWEDATRPLSQGWYILKKPLNVAWHFTCFLHMGVRCSLTYWFDRDFQPPLSLHWNHRFFVLMNHDTLILRIHVKVFRVLTGFCRCIILVFSLDWLLI